MGRRGPLDSLAKPRMGELPRPGPRALQIGNPAGVPLTRPTAALRLGLCLSHPATAAHSAFAILGPPLARSGAVALGIGGRRGAHLHHRRLPPAVRYSATGSIATGTPE